MQSESEGLTSAEIKVSSLESRAPAQVWVSEWRARQSAEAEQPQ